MKRFTSLFLLLCLLLTTALLSSCGNPKSLVNKAITKTEALNSYEVVIYTNVVTRAKDSMVEVPITVNMKVQDAKSDKPIIYADLTAESLGEVITMTLYMEDEWIYVCTGEGNYKIDRSQMQSNDFDYEADVENVLRQLPDSVFKDVEIVKNNDGSESIATDLPKEVFGEIYNGLVTSVHYQLRESHLDKNPNISNTKVNVTVNDGYIANYTVQFDIVVDIAGVETTSSVTSSLTFRNPGTDVRIAPPTGYLDFPAAPVQ